MQVATLSEPTKHFAAKASTVACRTLRTGAGVAVDCATVEVTDTLTSGTAGAAVGSGIGAGAGAAMTRVAVAARVRMKEEKHCILAVFGLGGRSGVWYWVVATWEGYTEVVGGRCLVIEVGASARTMMI